MGYSHINNLDEKKECRVAILLEDNITEVEGNVEVINIEGGNYAVFLHTGSYETLNKSYAKIQDWLAQSDVTLKNAPTFERHMDVESENENAGPESLQVFIHVPIV